MAINANKKKIVIVDPDDACRRIVSQRLGIAGYDIVQTADGAHAFDLIKDILPDAVLSETNIPKLNGRQLCYNLKQNPQTLKIPFIFLTHKSMTQDILSGYEAGASDYITKPFSLSVLEAKLRTALQS